MCSTSAMLPPSTIGSDGKRPGDAARKSCSRRRAAQGLQKNKRRSTDIFHSRPPARAQASPDLLIGLRIGDFRFWLLSGRGKECFPLSLALQLLRVRK